MAKIKKIVSLFLIILYVGYYVSTNFFIHTHNFVYGAVTHSHPYTSGTHNHSANALQLIDSLTNTLFVGSGAVFFLMLFPGLRTFIYSFYRQFTLHSLIGSNLLRAPPVSA